MSLASAFVRRARLVPTWAATALAVLLAAPSLGAGFALDDHIGRVFARGLLGEQSPPVWDLFKIVGSDSTRDFMVQEGWLPWWASEDLRVAFFRPLASLGHAVDYGMAPAWFGHLHSLAWLAVLVPCAAAAYRHLARASGGVGSFVGVATLLFAIDDAHASAAGWIASRNAIAAPALALLSLALHARARSAERPRTSWLGLLALGGALGFGEMAYGILGYFLGYALFLDARPGRLSAVAPFFGLCAIFMLTTALSGYGAAGSGLYISPWHDPASFVAAAAHRGPVLLGAILLVPPADLWAHLPPGGQHVLALVGLATVMVSAALFSRRLAREPLFRCLALGALLSVVVLCATFPADRLLTLPGFGAIGLVALYLRRIAEHATRSERAFSAALLSVHVGLAVLLGPLRALSTRPLAVASEQAVATAAADGAGFFVVVRAVDPLCSSLRWYLASYGARAEGAQCLAATAAPVEIERTGPGVLGVAPLGGFVPTPMDTLTRPRTRPFSVGDRVVVRGMEARVSAVMPDGRPARVEFAFDRPLEDIRLLEWAGDGYRTVEPPPVGGHLLLTGALGLSESTRARSAGFRARR